MRTALLAATATASVALVLTGGVATTSMARAAATQAAADMHERMTVEAPPDGGGIAGMHGSGMGGMDGADMDAMHTEMLAAMREHMPAADVERCQDMHEQMADHHPGAAAEGSNATTRGRGAHAAHHPDTTPTEG
jgi:hypothetical protein